MRCQIKDHIRRLIISTKKRNRKGREMVIESGNGNGNGNGELGCDDVRISHMDGRSCGMKLNGDQSSPGSRTKIFNPQSLTNHLLSSTLAMPLYFH